MESMNAQKASFKQWMAVAGGLMGSFMAVLDISITNASLQDIQGGLSATLDEGSWISTAYLVAEIIVIPLTAWLTQLFGLRRYLSVSAAVFVAASMLCGLAWDLPSMIFFRFIQGFFGGVLIPLAATLIVTQLPLAQRPLGLALFSLSVTFAPCVGPTVGGWLTVNYAWPYVFYINIVPGILLVFLIRYALEDKPMDLGLLAKADRWGILFMGLAMGSFTVVLEEGARKDWFGSALITNLSILAAASALGFLAVELRNPAPFINLRLLARKNFLLVNLTALAFGFGVYGSVFILPVFLAQIGKLDASQIGNVMVWSGLPQLLVIPFIPFLVKRFDNRVLAGIGMALFGVSALMNSGLTKDWGYDQFFWSQIVRAAGQPFIITCLSNLAFTGIAPAEVGSASGLFNMMRNLGGSVGIGSLGAMLDYRYHLHFTRLAESTSRFSLGVQQALSQRSGFMAGHFPGAGLGRAVDSIYGTLNREAFVMSYSDCFWVIGLMFFLSVALIGMMGKASAPGGAAAGGH